ncbi:MAG: class D sortase [Acidobacteria bacterium]|nr:class D sortase [Acidobacteriota bacterium]
MKLRLQGVVAQRLPRVLSAAHRVSLISATALLAWPLFVTADSAYAQWAGQRQLAAAQPAPGETIVSPQSRPASRPSAPAGSLLGEIDVPRLKLSYVLLEGTDQRTLDKSVGHVEGTSAIGDAGNIGIAGHRNTHFRKLEWIRRGDEIVLSSARGRFSYIVEWARLFRPDDLQVLHPEHGPAVTLITCYPFEYVGSAPLRFIVRALPSGETRARLMTRPAAAPPPRPADE